MDRGVWQALVVELQRVGHNRVSNTCVLAGVYPTDPGGGGQSLSRVQLFATPWTAARQASLSFHVNNWKHHHHHQVQSLGREDPLEKGMAPHSSILAWRIS